MDIHDVQQQGKNINRTLNPKIKAGFEADPEDVDGRDEPGHDT